MDLYNAFTLLLVVAAAFAYLNHRVLKLPAAIGLMSLALVVSLGLIGLARLGVREVLAVARLVGDIDFSQVLMNIMLSFLLFAGAIHVDARRLGELRWPVGLLASLGTMLSTALVGGAMYLLLPFLGLAPSLLGCLLFGALISPTDPVAVLSILTRANIPKDLEIKIVGESLFNDGVGVVIFVTLLGIAMPEDGAAPSLRHTALLFLREAGGGLLLGAVLGAGTAWLLRTIDNYQVEVLLTLALVMGGTTLATHLHASAPLAMVMAGLLVGYYSRSGGVMSDESQDYVDKFWELIDEILNALLFVLIGLEMLVLPISGLTLLAGLLAIVVLLAARLVAVALPLSLLRIRRAFNSSPHTLKVLTWGGLRGGISVALALSVPQSFPGRELLVGITYVVVIFSILVQGLTIGPLVKYLGLTQPVAAGEQSGH